MCENACECEFDILEKFFKYFFVFFWIFFKYIYCLSNKPGTRSFNCLLKDFDFASGLTGCRIRINCLPLSPSMLANLSFKLSRSGRCSDSTDAAESDAPAPDTVVVVADAADAVVAAAAAAAELLAAFGFFSFDLTRFILMADCLPFREPCDMANSTSSPIFRPLESELPPGVSIKSLTWKKSFLTSLPGPPLEYSM
jgi:hypothetical protein